MRGKRKAAPMDHDETLGPDGDDFNADGTGTHWAAEDDSDDDGLDEAGAPFDKLDGDDLSDLDQFDDDGEDIEDAKEWTLLRALEIDLDDADGEIRSLDDLLHFDDEDAGDEEAAA